jgi:hypothetical protein
MSTSRREDGHAACRVRAFFVIVALICAFTAGIRGTFALHEFRSRGEI